MAEDFGTKSLAKKFGRRFGGRRRQKESDDAPLLIPRNSECFTRLFDSLALVGRLPWEKNETPQILLRYPKSDTKLESVLPFMFPHGCPITLKQYSRSSIMKEIFGEVQQQSATLHPYYFPQIDSSPYVFCLRFRCNPLTVPFFGHDQSLEDVFQYVKNLNTIPQAELCLCICTKFPYYTLFEGLTKWLLSCEQIARSQIFPCVDTFFESGVFEVPMDIAGSVLVQKPWPEGHREAFSDLLPLLYCTSAPAKGGPPI